MTIKDDIYAAHIAPDAYAGGAENTAIESLRLELQSLIDDAVKNADNGMCHQLLVFGNQVGDYARRGRAQAEAANNLANPALSDARLVMSSAKELLNKEGEITPEEKAALLKEIESKLGV
jgi:hypothetical protein